MIELSRVGHLDSTGLGVLIAFRKRTGADETLTLAGAQPNMLNLLRTTGLERTFEIVPSLAEPLDQRWTRAGFRDQPVRRKPR